MIQYLIIMKYSIILTFASSLLIYDSTCYGDACQINGLSQEELKNLSYDPPRNELLSEAQDKKAWQTFVETYEIPVGKVQNWYNSIVDKNSADAAAKSFSTEVSPILKKLTGSAADMKKQVLSIPASPEMQKFLSSFRYHERLLRSEAGRGSVQGRLSCKNHRVWSHLTYAPAVRPQNRGVLSWLRN